MKFASPFIIALLSYFTLCTFAVPLAIPSDVDNIPQEQPEVTIASYMLDKRSIIITKPKTTIKTTTRTTIITPPSSPPPSGGGVVANQEAPLSPMLPSVNIVRSQAGAPALTFNSKLAAACMAHARDMAATQIMTHTGSDGSQPWDRVQSFGYNWSAVAENIAAGQTTVASVMNAWVLSKGHYANLISRSVTEFGYGMAVSSSGCIYWSQCFGSQR